MTTTIMFAIVSALFAVFALATYWQEVRAEKRKEKEIEVLSQNAKLLQQIIEQQGEENGRRDRHI